MPFSVYGSNSAYRSTIEALPEILVSSSSLDVDRSTATQARSHSFPRVPYPVYDISEEDENSESDGSNFYDYGHAGRNSFAEFHYTAKGRRRQSLAVGTSLPSFNFASRRTSCPTPSSKRFGRYSFTLDYGSDTKPYYLRRPRSVQIENTRLLLRQCANFNSSMSQLSNESSSLSDSYRSSDSNIRLEEHIKLHHLQKLLHQFKTHVPMGFENENEGHRGVALQRSKDSNEYMKQKPGMMNLEEFKAIISGMLGTTKWNDQMEMLFYKVDTACDGFVDWNEFCTYMLLQMREIEHNQRMKMIPFTTQAIVKRAYHNKQETTTKMLLVENPARIINISKVGDIGVWDLELRLLKTYKLSSNASAEQNAAKRRCHTWVTDAVYMSNAQKFALTTTSREIYFYDTSTTTYYAEFCLYALSDVPNCMNYWFNEKSRNSHSILVFGDDTGSVHLLHFHLPQSRLFEKPFNPQQGTQRVYFNDLPHHKRYVTYTCIQNVHQDVIRRVLYVPDGEVIISSSVASATSVVLMDIHKKKKPYVYKVNKGVECFDYSKSLNTLVTGSLDHLVRLWNPYVVSKPICILQGHSTGICDVLISREFSQLISYSKDAVVKVWDIKEHNCLQTISLKVPSLQPGRIPDHGEFPVSLFGPPHDLMLVSCNDCIALLKMGKLEPPPEAPTTHKTALCGAIYNSLFHQVVTACDDSTVSVWNIENGARSLKFSDAHGQEEVTCLAFDKTCRRLFTGARDGTIKVWNFQNGNCLHEMESVSDAEVTGLMSFQDRTILAVGWSRQITLYGDSDPDLVFVKANQTWKGGQVHKDDILTVDHCEPNLLATGSYDGTIILWNEETQQVSVMLRDASNNKSSNQFAPVEKLRFLQDRVSRRLKNSAVLLSSEAGWIHWWSIYGHNSLVGRFCAVETQETSVLGIDTSPDNSILVTADTEGFVAVWNIEDYCVSERTTIKTERPPEQHRWKAHDRAIVSIEYIEHELLVLVLTASSDKTARLWTLDGNFIGTFGQPKKWDLKLPATFQHPIGPWGNLAEISQLKNVIENEIFSDGSQKPVLSTLAEEEDENIEVAMNGVHEYPDKLQEHEESITIELPDALNETNGISEDNDAMLSPSSGSNSTESSVTPEPNQGNILGEKAEKHLAQRTVTRQERRCRVGYIDPQTTSRFAGLCSPFQALSIPKTNSVDFTGKLPMSKRMQDRGMSCISEDDLWKLPLNNLSEFGEHDHSLTTLTKHRANSSKSKSQHSRRGHFLPPLSRTSSFASYRNLGEKSTASSVSGSR